MVRIKKVPPGDPVNLFSYQHCYINNSLTVEFNKWALIPYNNYLKCVCKIISVSDISRRFYSIETNVLHYSAFSDLHYLRSESYDFLHTEGIKILPLCKVNSVVVSVVFENITDACNWSNNLYYLQGIIKNILMLFTVVNNSIISTHNIKEMPCNGIYYIIVHNIGNKKCAGTISKSTAIVIKNVISLPIFQTFCSGRSKKTVPIFKQQSDYLRNLVKAHITDLSSVKQKLSNKILLIGPRGSGKSLLINTVVTEMKLLSITIDASQLIYPDYYNDHGSLTSCFREASLLAKEDKNGVCIVLIKNAEHICQEMDKSLPYDNQISAEFRYILDNNIYQDGVIIVAATSNVYLINPTFRRAGRLEIEMYIGILSESDRRTVVELFCDKGGLDKKVCKQVAIWTPGYIVADLAYIVYKVAKLQMRSSTTPLISVFRSCINKYQSASTRSDFIVTYARNATMNKLGGMESVKAALKSYIELPLKYPKKFLDFGVSVPKGLLLYGPPGCAKTSLVCALANSLNVSFLSISAAELYSPYVGVAEKNVVELFNKARVNSPAILFIDEIDALVGSRQNVTNNVRQNVLSTFLTELDGVGTRIDLTHSRNIFADNDNEDNLTIMSSTAVIVIAATNRPDKLDSALIRPGRFDKLLYVDLPNEEDRLKILQIVIKNSEVPIAPDVDLPKIAKETIYYSGADLTQLIRESAMAYLASAEECNDTVSHEYFSEGLKQVKSSISQEQIEFYKKFQF